MAEDNLGEAIVLIKADLSALRKDFETARKDTNSQTDKLGADLSAQFGAIAKRVGPILAGIFAVDSIVNFAKASVTAFSEQENAMANLQSVITATGHAAGFTASQLAEQASALQETTIYGDEAVIGMQSLLATFTKIRGDNFTEATKAAADMATIMGGDLKGAALQLGKALENPAQSFGLLRRAGIYFSDGQTDVIKKLQETGRLADAQKIILDAVKDKFNGAAEAAGKTFSGELARLANSFGEVQEQIGAVISAGLTPFVSMSREMIMSAVKTNSVVAVMSAGLTMLLVPLNMLAKTINTVSTVFKLLANAGAVVMDQMVSYVVSSVNTMVQSFISFILATNNVMNAVKEFLGPKLGKLIGVMAKEEIASWQAKSIAMQNYTDDVKRTAKDTVNNFGVIVDNWKANDDQITKSFESSAQAIADASVGLTEDMKAANDANAKNHEKTNNDIVNDTKVKANKWANEWLKHYVRMQEQAKANAAKWSKTWEDHIEKLKGMWDSTPDFFEQTADKIKIKLAELFGEEGIAAVKTVITAFSAAFDITTQIVGQFASLPGMLISAVTSIVNLPKQIADSIKSFGDSLAEAPGILDKLTENLPAILDKIIADAPKFIESLSKNIPIFINTLAEKLPELIPAFIGIVEAFLNALVANVDKLVEMFIQVALSFLDKLIEILPELIPVFIRGAIALALALIDRIDEIIIAFVEGFINAIPDIIEGFISALPKLFEVFFTLPFKLIGKLVELAPKFIGALISGAGKFMQTIWDAFAKIPQMLWDGIKKIFDFGSLFGGDLFGGLFGGGDTQTPEQQAANAAWEDVQRAEEQADKAWVAYRKAQKEADETQSQFAINRAKQLKADAEAADAFVNKLKADAQAADVLAQGGGAQPTGAATDTGLPPSEDTFAMDTETTPVMKPTTTVIDTTALMTAIDAFNAAIASFNLAGDTIIKSFDGVTEILAGAGNTFSDIILAGMTSVVDMFKASVTDFAITFQTVMEPTIIALAQVFAFEMNLGIKKAMDDLGVLGEEIAALIRSLIGEIPTDIAPSAMGNVFSGVQRFAGGGEIVNRVTPFRFGGGKLGVMGEAGPEAVLPLERGQDGKLGVKSGGNSPVSITVNVSGSILRESELIDNIELSLKRRLALDH